MFGHSGLKFQYLFWRLFVSRVLFVPIVDSKFERLGLVIVGFRLEMIEESKLSLKLFFMISGLIFVVFRRPWEQFFVFLIFAALETGLNINVFSVV